ncbi:glycosyltransferase [Jeotgalibacillus terrae]|uniref:Glycosyltransferase family 2 protein n=1 Tax=Jeotgalibacillus terrae TaxID=587735 RepID=A0ABW5ZG22_9BACL|nr:glycosyltransferase involved in cell wall biosynthesis [Jeotgalibacillus terrae]
MKTLSIVIPCYNEEETVQKFYDETKQWMEKISADIEYVFVDDGSSDRTLPMLKEMAEQDDDVHYISFSRNFGKEAAILAGFQYAKGDAVVLIDADLQHPPSLIPMMWKHFEDGYDQVIAKRNRAGEKFTRKKLTNLYYKLVNRLVEVEITDGVGDFRLLSRQALNALLSLTEYNRFSKGLFSWIGFHEKMIEYENQIRVEGSSKWSFASLLNYGMDGILSFNNKPLRIAIYSGIGITTFGFIYILITLVNYFINGVETPGYFTTISAIILLGGIQLLFLGIIGEYIGRIYYETKRRPQYLIKEKN